MIDHRPSQIKSNASLHTSGSNHDVMKAKEFPEHSFRIQKKHSQTAQDTKDFRDGILSLPDLIHLVQTALKMNRKTGISLRFYPDSTPEDNLGSYKVMNPKLQSLDKSEILLQIARQIQRFRAMNLNDRTVHIESQLTPKDVKISEKAVVDYKNLGIFSNDEVYHAVGHFYAKIMKSMMSSYPWDTSRRLLLGDAGVVLADIHFGGEIQRRDAIPTPAASVFNLSYKNRRLMVSHYCRVTSNSHEEVFVELKENLGKFFSDYNNVWVSFYLSQDQKVPFTSVMSYCHEDHVWRANIGIFLQSSWLRYEVYASGMSKNKTPLLVHDDCKYECKPHTDYQLEFSRGTTEDSKIVHISFMSRVIGTYMYLNEYLFTQNLEKQISCCQRQPVRNLKKDPLAQQFLSKHKVYVSMTTSPKRIQYVTYVLRSLDLNLVEKILISLPERYGRDGSEYVIPQELLDFPKVHIIRIPVDLGPITKLLPAAEYVQSIDPDSLIVTIDDDVGYPKGMIAEYIHAVVQRDRTVVGMRGFDLSYWKINDFGFPKAHGGRLGRHPQVQILEGFCGIAYPAKYVDVELMKHLSRKDLFPECFVSDDLVISFALALCKVDRVAVNTRFYNIKKICPLKYGFEADALHQGGGTDLHVVNNPIGLNSLKYKKSFRKLINHTFDFQRLCLKSREEIF